MMDATVLPKHSPLGASSMARWMACPGSVQLIESLPVKDRRMSIYAARGVLAHDIIEQCGTSWGKLLPESFLGRQITVGGHELTVDLSMVEALGDWMEHVNLLMQRADKVLFEAEVSLDSYLAPGELPVSVYGTADLLAYIAKEKTLVVSDYKHGAGKFVATDDNPQLYFYAAGALAATVDPVQWIETTIVQPNAPGEKVRTVRLATIDVLMWVEDVFKPAARRTQSVDAVLTPGAQCNFCVAKTACPALEQVVMHDAQKAFGPVSVERTPHELADALTVALAAEIWIEAVRDEAKARIESGEHVPGWTLIPTRPVRKWIDGQETEVMRLLKAKGYRPGDYTHAPDLLSPAQIDKLTKKRFDTEPYVARVSGGTKLAQIKENTTNGK